ncbi:MAG: YitT family protein [Bacilli bacterium]
MILKRRRKISLNNIDKIINNKNAYKNFFLFVMGMLICSISINLFYKPYDVVTIGSSGLAILINNYINIDLSLIIFAISSIMLVLSFGVFGIEYGMKSILGTIFYPIFIKATSLLCKVVSFDGVSLFLIICMGGVLMGIGFGIIKKSGYSLGGFNFLYDYFHKRFNISVGKSNLLCNLLIVILSIFAFGISRCIYAFIGLYIMSYVSDRVMIGISRNKAFYIVTRKSAEVKDYIVNDMNYTATIVNAKGGYSDKKRKMLVCVIPTVKYSILKETIREIDKDAFFLITDSYFVSK